MRAMTFVLALALAAALAPATSTATVSPHDGYYGVAVDPESGIRGGFWLYAYGDDQLAYWITWRGGEEFGVVNATRDIVPLHAAGFVDVWTTSEGDRVVAFAHDGASPEDGDAAAGHGLIRGWSLQIVGRWSA